MATYTPSSDVVAVTPAKMYADYSTTGSVVKATPATVTDTDVTPTEKFTVGQIDPYTDIPGSSINGADKIVARSITPGRLTGNLTTNGVMKIKDSTFISDETVNTAEITDSAVTTAKIADTAVTTAKIANNAVTTAKIANNAVTADKIADSAITTAKIKGLDDTSNTDAGKFITIDNNGDGFVLTDTPSIQEKTVTPQQLSYTNSAIIANSIVTVNNDNTNMFTYATLATLFKSNNFSVDSTHNATNNSSGAAIAAGKTVTLNTGIDMLNALGIKYLNVTGSGNSVNDTDISNLAYYTYTKQDTSTGAYNLYINVINNTAYDLEIYANGSVVTLADDYNM